MAKIKGLWVFVSFLAAYEASQSVNFTSNGQSYTSMSISPGNLYYGKDLNSGWSVGRWVNEAYRIVDFGQEEQTVDDDFKDWIKDNAKPIVTADLTDTTWDIKNDWTATAGYGVFNVESEWTLEEDNTYSGYFIAIGYSANEEDLAPTQPTANTIQINETPMHFYRYSQLTVVIIGGTDVTNPSLIYWLASNGTMREQIFSVAIDNPFGVRVLTKDKIVERNIIATPVLQEKSIKPTKVEQRISADEGYAGLGKVTIEAIPANFREVVEFDFENDIEISGGESEDVDDLAGAWKFNDTITAEGLTPVTDSDYLLNIENGLEYYGDDGFGPLYMMPVSAEGMFGVADVYDGESLGFLYGFGEDKISNQTFEFTHVGENVRLWLKANATKQ